MKGVTIDHTFRDDATLSNTFAEIVAANLRAGIDARGAALIGVSGGTTPRNFFSSLSQQKLDWSRVTVTLCDDRWVPPNNERSNEHLLRETLLRNEAAPAKFVPLCISHPQSRRQHCRRSPRISRRCRSRSM